MTTFQYTNLQTELMIHFLHICIDISAAWPWYSNCFSSVGPHIFVFETFSMWMFLKNDTRGTPKSSILIGFCIINHLFGIPLVFGNTHIARSFVLEKSSFFLPKTWMCLKKNSSTGFPRRSWPKTWEFAWKPERNKQNLDVPQVNGRGYQQCVELTKFSGPWLTSNMTDLESRVYNWK